MLHQMGDSVAVKLACLPKQKGTVAGFSGSKVLVSVDGCPAPLPFDPDSLRNYSAAARKAWGTMRSNHLSLPRPASPDYYSCGKLQFLVSNSKSAAEADLMAILYVEETVRGKLLDPGELVRSTKNKVSYSEAENGIARYQRLSSDFGYVQLWGALGF
jgi:hypothetical protein